MVCATTLQVCKQVKRELAIVLRVFNLLYLFLRKRRFTVFLLMLEGPWFFALCQVHDQATMGHSEPEAFLETALEVTALFEFVGYP
jgi:hypothetical protein